MDNTDISKRLVFARSGWCKFYVGAPGDALERGGSFNDGDEGSEKYNFLVINGHVYGHVYGATDGFRPKRVTGNAAEALKDICVAVFATEPDGLGQVLVGWFRHATAFDHWIKRPLRDRGVYSWSSAANDAVLLPIRERKIAIPKGKDGSGQAQVTYARGTDGKLKQLAWIKTVQRFIASYKGDSLVGLSGSEMASELTALDAEDILRGQNIVESASLRNVIEDHAMKRVRAELQREGYEEIEDVSNFESYDFRARKGRAIRKIEVKGTRTIGEAILFSRNEVTLAEAERVELYVVQEIEVTEKNGNIKARGGTIRKIENWGRRNFAKAALSWQVQIA